MECPTTPTADGPCALGIRAFDAVEFANESVRCHARTTARSTSMTAPFRIPDIDPGTSPFIGLGIDDKLNAGPAGVTMSSGVADAKLIDMTSAADFEAFIVSHRRRPSGQTSGGPGIAAGSTR